MDRRYTRRDFLRRSVVAGVGISTLPALLAACGGGSGGGQAAAAIPTSGKDMSMEELIEAAKGEGTLNTIALPPDWANYGEIMETYQKKYGLRINNQSPNAASAEEHEAVKSLKGQDRAPDVLDVGASFAPEGKADGLYAEYKNAQWETVPEFMKDADGFWVGDYYGVISFGVNEDAAGSAPRTFEDLKKPDYKGKVALNGDPRTAGAAFAAVYAASVANGGSLDDIGPGIEYFAELKSMGNYIPVDANPSTIQNGQTPVTIDWDYLQTGYGDQFKDQLTWGVQIPEDSVFGNFYAQAINAEAPNPFAARLWQEFLYSDEGQLLWLKGYTHPARFEDLNKKGAIPEELLSKLPPAESYTNIEFPNQAQTDAAKALLEEEWPKQVAGA